MLNNVLNMLNNANYALCSDCVNMPKSNAGIIGLAQGNTQHDNVARAILCNMGRLTVYQHALEWSLVPCKLVIFAIILAFRTNRVTGNG